MDIFTTDARAADGAAAPALSFDELRIASGDAVFSRALPYVAYVHVLELSATYCLATSTHTNAYVVELWWGRSGIQGRCTCPHHGVGNFCKHMCALGLRLLFDDVSAGEATYSAEPSPVSFYREANVANPVSLLDTQEQSFLLTLAAEHGLSHSQICDIAALKDLSDPLYRGRVMDDVRAALSPRFVPRDPSGFYRDVELWILRCHALVVFGHGGFAYQILDHILRRFAIILGSTCDDAVVRDGLVIFRGLLDAHQRASEFCSSVEQLAIALITLRETKSVVIPFSFVPYARVLGEDGLAALDFGVSVLRERLSDAGVVLNSFSSAHADSDRIRQRQMRELALMEVELAYLDGDYARVQEWASPLLSEGLRRLARVPAQIAVALAESNVGVLPGLIKQLQRGDLLHVSGVRGLDDPDLFSSFRVHPRWAVEVLGDSGFRSEAVDLAFSVLCDALDKDSAQLWMASLEKYSDYPAQDYARLFPWLVSHACEVADRAVDVLVALDDASAVWAWDEEVGLGAAWEGVVFNPLRNRGFSSDRRADDSCLSWRPHDVQRSLERAGDALMVAVKSEFLGWPRLSAYVAQLAELAHAADVDLHTDSHSVWVASFQRRVWAFHPSTFQSRTHDLSASEPFPLEEQ